MAGACIESELPESRLRQRVTMALKRKGTLMPQLLLLGLDPGGASPIPSAAREFLARSAALLAGNPKHPLIRQAGGECVREASAAGLRKALAGRQDTAYIAVGHPLLDDGSAREFHAAAVSAGWEVEVVGAPSLLELAYTKLALGSTPHTVAGGPAPAAAPWETALLVLAANVSPRALRELARRYPAGHEVDGLALAGGPEPVPAALPLREAMARHCDVICVPPVTPLQMLEAPQTLRWLMARLRAPDGCPWDQEQTHQTLRKHLLEETAEVLDALDEDDMVALREELGDLLLQVYFQAQVAEEQGDFTFDDVVRGISEKLVRRHPHVFGDRAVGSAEQALANWEQIKQEEYAAQGKERRSLLDGVPRSLSGLATAQAIGNTVVKVGFDWPDVQGVVVKLREEIDELVAAESVEHRFEELGDVLFVLAQVAKWLQVDAEEALRASNAKFRRRFAYMEDVARHAGSELGDYSFEKLDSLWEEAKLATSDPWGCPR